MIELLAAPQTFPFTVALGLMVGIAMLEGVMTLLGAGLSSLVDGLLPDLDPGVDVDVDLDLDAGFDADAGGLGTDASGGADAAVLHSGILTQTLSWLRFGQVPALILFAIFLTAFGLAGLLGQTLLHGVTGLLAPGWLASVPAFLLALPVVRTVGGAIARVLPKEETTAVSQRTFVGRVGHIVLGTARAGAPAQARLRDQHGRTHYVMVEPDVSGETFGQGEPVLLVRIDGSRFRVIHPPSDALVAPAREDRS